MVPYTFPLTGEYEIQIRLTRDRDEKIEGLNEAHDLELLLDRDRVHLFPVTPVAGDADLHLRIPVTAGPHEVAVTFLKKASVLLEGTRQPYQAHFNSYRHPRVQPAIYSVSIVGPYAATGPGDTPSRRRIFVSHPATRAAEEASAHQILSTLMRRAYRRPVTPADFTAPMALFQKARAGADFDAGIEMALSARARESRVPLPRGDGPGRSRAEHAIPRERHRPRVAAVVLSLEQHPGRRAADARRRWARCISRRCSSSRCGACWPTSARARS